MIPMMPEISIPVTTDGTYVEGLTITGSTTGNLTFLPTWSAALLSAHTAHVKRFYFNHQVGKLTMEIDTWSGSGWNTTTKSVTFT